MSRNNTLHFSAVRRLAAFGNNIIACIKKFGLYLNLPIQSSTIESMRSVLPRSIEVGGNIVLYCFSVS